MYIPVGVEHCDRHPGWDLLDNQSLEQTALGDYHEKFH
jgi:hypothetical protein